MKRLIRAAATLLLVLAVNQAIAADKAKTFYNKGKDAEARQNYEQAYDYYKQAYDLKPGDLTYRSAFERLRFLAGASMVHRGQLLREAGQLDAALAEFQKAAEIDPSSAVAQQEIRHTKEMIDAAKSAAPKASIPPSALQKRLSEAGGPVELSTISNVPINLKITEEFLNPDRAVPNGERTRWSLVYELSPIQFVQIRTGLRYYDGIPQDNSEHQRLYFVELHGFF